MSHQEAFAYLGRLSDDCRDSQAEHYFNAEVRTATIADVTTLLEKARNKSAALLHGVEWSQVAEKCLEVLKILKGLSYETSLAKSGVRSVLEAQVTGSHVLEHFRRMAQVWFRKSVPTSRDLARMEKFFRSGSNVESVGSQGLSQSRIDDNQELVDTFKQLGFSKIGDYEDLLHSVFLVIDGQADDEPSRAALWELGVFCLGLARLGLLGSEKQYTKVTTPPFRPWLVELLGSEDEGGAENTAAAKIDELAKFVSETSDPSQANTRAKPLVWKSEKLQKLLAFAAFQSGTTTAATVENKLPPEQYPAGSAHWHELATTIGKLNDKRNLSAYLDHLSTLISGENTTVVSRDKLVVYFVILTQIKNQLVNKFILDVGPDKAAADNAEWKVVIAEVDKLVSVIVQKFEQLDTSGEGLATSFETEVDDALRWIRGEASFKAQIPAALKPVVSPTEYALNPDVVRIFTPDEIKALILQISTSPILDAPILADRKEVDSELAATIASKHILGAIVLRLASEKLGWAILESSSNDNRTFSLTGLRTLIEAVFYYASSIERFVALPASSRQGFGVADSRSDSSLLTYIRVQRLRNQLLAIAKPNSGDTSANIVFPNSRLLSNFS